MRQRLTVGRIDAVERTQVIEADIVGTAAGDEAREERNGDRDSYGSKPALRISSYMLCPPRLIVRHCAAIMIFKADSSLMSPANPGTSGSTTTTWASAGRQERTSDSQNFASAHLELSTFFGGRGDSLN
jgi:hypothetical protein